MGRAVPYTSGFGQTLVDKITRRVKISNAYTSCNQIGKAVWTASILVPLISLSVVSISLGDTIYSGLATLFW